MYDLLPGAPLIRGFRMTGHNVIGNGYVYTLTVGDDSAFLVISKRVARNRAAGAAGDGERPKVDPRTMLGAVQRGLTDVMDSAIGDAGRDRVGVAVHKDAEIIRPIDVGGINPGIYVVNIHGNIATGGIDRASDWAGGIDHGGGHVDAVAVEAGWCASHCVEAEGGEQAHQGEQKCKAFQ